MSWRNPQYAYRHAARDAGAAAITPDATVDANFPKQNLIDNRMTVPFKWTNSIIDHQIDIDQGASFPTELNRLWIPPGHNLPTAHIQVEEDDNSGFTSPTTLFADTLIGGLTTTAVDITITASSERYLRVSFPTVAGAWEFNQLFITELITTTRGPEPNWIDQPRSNVLQFESGDSVQLDPDQRFIEYSYRWLGREVATDLTKIEALVDYVSTHRPFLLDTAYDIADGGATLMMKMERDARARNDVRAPQVTARRKGISIAMLEYLG